MITMKINNRDDLLEAIDFLITKERDSIVKSIEIQLSCCPPFMDKITTDDGDIEFDKLNLRKIVKEFILERDGTIDIEDEIGWLNEWAKEFDSYSKKMKRKAAILSKQLK